MSFPLGQLGDHVSFSNGKSSPERSDDGTFPVFGSNGLIGFANQSNAPANTSIIGRVGTYCGSMHFSTSASWVTDNAIKASAKNEPEARFWFYAMLNRDLHSLRAGSGQPLINQTVLNQVELPIPPEPDRLKIAAVLGALDDKIELNRKTAATLEAMARALYRSWFVDFDPVHAKAQGRSPAHMDASTAALFPATFTEDGLPEGWHEEPIINQADWINGAAYNNMHFSNDPKALPVVKIAELKAGINANTKFTATDLGAKYRIGRGDLLFSWSGNPDTSIDAFVWALGDAWLNQHIFAVRENGRMSKAALFCVLRFFKPEFAEIARNKQTTGLGHITRKDLEAFPVRIASEGVERAFEALVAPLFERYCTCLYENQTLAQLRDTLLPRLMSGDLRVAAAREHLEDVA